MKTPFYIDTNDVWGWVRSEDEMERMVQRLAAQPGFDETTARERLLKIRLCENHASGMPHFGDRAEHRSDITLGAWLGEDEGGAVVTMAPEPRAPVVPNYKRFCVPGCVVTAQCPNCGKTLKEDLESNYISYPTLNAPTRVSLYCYDEEADEECGEAHVYIVITVAARPATPKEIAAHKQKGA